MANSFYTPTMVAKEILRLMENELVMAKKVTTDLSSEFVMAGESIKVRRQAQYLGQDNNLDLTSYTEDVIEGTATVTMDQTWSNKVTIGAKDRTLSFDRYSDMVLKPMARRAAEKIEASIAAEYPKFYWFDGTPGTVPATFSALADAGAIMTDGGIAQTGRVAFHSPTASAKLAATVASTYVSGDNKNALQEATIGRFAGFDNYESVFAPTHPVGVATGTPLVNGAAQNVTYAASKDTWSQSLVTDGWTNSTAGILKAGDIITIAGVFAVNPSTKASTGRLQTFPVLADATSGATTGPATLTISPPIITSGAYQTVTAAPADNAAITVKTGTGGTGYRQSLLLDPSALTLVSRPLDVPNDGQGVKTSTQQGNKVIMTVTEWVDGNTLAQNMRFDMLWKAYAIDPRRGMRFTS